MRQAAAKSRRAYALVMRPRLWFAALLAVALGACTTTDTDAGSSGLHPADGGAVACLDYPYVGFREFPYLLHPPSEVFPTCTPSCHPHIGAAGVSRAPSNQDLPSGPCDDEGAACNSALTSDACGICHYTGGSGSGYLCSCRDHRWQCAITSQGGATCEPPACLLDDPSQRCTDFSRTATQVCLCGKCHELCASNAECQSGTTCQLDEICVPSRDCPGPDECTAPCTGFCK